MYKVLEDSKPIKYTKHLLRREPSTVTLAIVETVSLLRSERRPGFQSPFSHFNPSCGALSIRQGFVCRSAGAVTVIWSRIQAWVMLFTQQVKSSSYLLHFEPFQASFEAIQKARVEAARKFIALGHSEGQQAEAKRRSGTLGLRSVSSFQAYFVQADLKGIQILKAMNKTM